MWKQKDEPARPTSVPASPAQAPSVPVQTPSLSSQTPSYSSTSSGGEQTQKETLPMHEEMASIGKSIVINGELSGSEDLTIEGRVDGKIELKDHILTVGSNGRIKAQVSAKAIVVLGQVTGNLNATEKVDIKESGSVEGDIVAPRVAIADVCTSSRLRDAAAAAVTLWRHGALPCPLTMKSRGSESMPVKKSSFAPPRNVTSPCPPKAGSLAQNASRAHASVSPPAKRPAVVCRQPAQSASRNERMPPLSCRSPSPLTVE